MKIQTQARVEVRDQARDSTDHNRDPVQDRGQALKNHTHQNMIRAPHRGQAQAWNSRDQSRDLRQMFYNQPRESKTSSQAWRVTIILARRYSRSRDH